jgi:tyrosine-protein kinase Etk/Wzc
MENITPTTSDNLNLKEFVAPYLQRWPWILLSILFFMGGSYLYLRYTTSIYKSESSILIKDTGDSGLSELSALGDLGGLGNNYNSLVNEVQILKSRRLMKKVVTSLNLEVGYFSEGAIKTSEVYKAAPFKIKVVYPATQEPIQPFKIWIKAADAFQFSYSFNPEVSFKSLKTGQNLSKNGVDLLFFPNLNLEKSIDKGVQLYAVQVYDLEDITRSYLNNLQLDSGIKNSSVINLSITDPIPSKATDILDELVVVYNEDAITDKNYIAKNTVDFIDARLQNVLLSLDSVELKKQRFKTDNQITNIAEEALIDLASQNQYRNRETELSTQIAIASDLLTFVQNTGSEEVLPVNLAFDDLSVNSSINKYNELVIRLRKALQTATVINPVVEELEVSRRNLKATVVSSLNTYIQTLNTQLKSVVGNENVVNFRIAEVPAAERITRDIERNQTIIESIYIYLLEKKEEAAISLAIKSPKAKIIDVGLASRSPLFPQTSQILLGSLIAGLLLPIGLIYIINLLYNKIENRKDVTRRLSSVPFLGEIPRLASGESDMITINDRSVLAESFRLLRTNLQYKIAALPNSEKTPIIIVTSSVKGEGKTFVSFNLAMTIANSGKKVLLIGGDIRNPQLHRYLAGGSKRLKGVTEFLVYPQYTAEEFIHSSDLNENLQIMLSGSIPPNPAELWMSERVEELLKYGKENFDTVIIDSAPAMLVTDTLLIGDKADITIYVTRANYTEKPLLDFVSDTVETGKLTNVGMVLNNVKTANFGYGNKYAYSYGVDKESIWIRFLKFMNIKK